MSLLFFSALAACGTGRPAARVPRALPACFCALSLLAWWPGWALRDSMRRSRAAGAPAAVARDQALKALRLAPGDCFAWENLSRARLRGPWPDPAGAARALREARRLNPTNAAFALQLADLARLRGDWALCGREAAEALDLEPRCLRARLLLCIALGRQGRLLPSREAFAPAPALRRELAALRDLKGYDAAVLGVDEALYAEASSAAGG
jgi:cytochrome c-type biogenesis protein CcmH/NrfG